MEVRVQASKCYTIILGNDVFLGKPGVLGKVKVSPDKITWNNLCNNTKFPTTPIYTGAKQYNLEDLPLSPPIPQQK